MGSLHLLQFSISVSGYYMMPSGLKSPDFEGIFSCTGWRFLVMYDGYVRWLHGGLEQ